MDKHNLSPNLDIRHLSYSPLIEHSGRLEDMFHNLAYRKIRQSLVQHPNQKINEHCFHCNLPLENRKQSFELLQLSNKKTKYSQLTLNSLLFSSYLVLKFKVRLLSLRNK